MSAARPKIADYPFTTLVPNLGVVSAAEQSFTVADVPGLIQGASDGRGLGLEFLRHVERSSVLVHMLDCAALDPGRDPLTDLDVIERELDAYGGGGLTGRPRVVALTKVDVPEARELAELVRPELQARGLEVFSISAATHEGLRLLTLRLAQLVAVHRAEQAAPEPTRIVLRPMPVGGADFAVREVGEQAYEVTGAKPVRWVRQTDFANEEAVGFLGDRLAKLGVEAALAEFGAQRGAEVTIADVTFDWEPTVAEATAGPRGTDTRVAANGRKSRDQRHAEYIARHTPYETVEGRKPHRSERSRIMTRPLVTAARRIVVKIGSSSLTTAAGGLDSARVDALVDAVVGALDGGPEHGQREVVLVSSGAISAGIAPLGLPRRPRDLATLQACASVGQLLLAERYAASFARYARSVGQVLLTSEDVVRRAHYRNARRTLERLLALGVVPILNENDAVATEEIRFSGNDRLAALVAHLVTADLLILLTDVDGVFERNPRSDPSARRLSEVKGPEDLGDAAFRGVGAAAVGSGGMRAKVDAALLAASEGCAAIVGSAADAAPLMAGEERGTLFLPAGRRLPSRLRWLAHASAPSGRLHLDPGAVLALVERGKSLLPAGITAVDGDFGAGDPVELLDPDGYPIGRGLVGYDAAELPAMLGRSTLELGPERSREVVHRDDLVLLHRTAAGRGRSAR